MTAVHEAAPLADTGVLRDDGSTPMTQVDTNEGTKEAPRNALVRWIRAKDPDLLAVHVQWETALRKAVQELPQVRFGEAGLAP